MPFLVYAFGVTITLLSPFVFGQESFTQPDGSSTAIDPSDYKIYMPLTLYMKKYSYAFMLETNVKEASDRLVMMRKAADFCYESLSQLQPHWVHYYSDPILCQGDVMNAIQGQVDDYMLKLSGEPVVTSYTLSSDKWCVNQSWVRNLMSKEKSITSQGGQDGILEYIFSDEAIGPTNKFYVEIGFNSPHYEGGSGANTYNLHRNGWNGLLLDIDYENATINLRKHLVTAKNIVRIFDTYNVPLEPDYVSIDIDSHDLWVLRAIISSGKYRPRVLTVEFNANLPFASTLTIPPNSELANANMDLLFGASAGALKAVAEEFGYTVVHVIDKLDLVLVRNDLINDGGCPMPFFLSYYKFSKVQHCITHPKRMFHWIDYETWRLTYGNIVKATSAAAEMIVESVYSRSPSKDAKDRELKCLGVDMTKLTINHFD